MSQKPAITGHERKKTFETARFLATAGIGRTLLTLRKDEKVFSQGQVSEAAFYIHTGRIKVIVTSRHGKEAVVAILGPDEFFGESCLTGEKRRVSSARAMSECHIMRIDRAAMINAIQNAPAFAMRFIQHLLARATRVEAGLVDLMFNSSEKRLARTLLVLAGLAEGDSSRTVVTKVSQDMLASMTGTTRSRISHFMNKFRTLGFIDYDHDRIEVRSLLLTALRDKPRSKAAPDLKP